MAAPSLHEPGSARLRSLAMVAVLAASSGAQAGCGARHSAESTAQLTGGDGAQVSALGAASDAGQPGSAQDTATVSADAPGTFEGRPIAPTMSHLGADWLTREERTAEEDPDALHAALAVQAGQTACDVGAGSGYHTVRLGRAVGPRGRVVASDLQPEMLALLRAYVAEQGLQNVVAVAATATDPGLPEGGCDLIVLVDVYHELAEPEAMLVAMRRALAPGGRLVLVEFRGEDPDVPIKPEHKMTRAQVLRELQPRGFRLTDEPGELPWQHVMVFERAP